MAYQKHYKLPPYRLTQRFGAVVDVRSIHRGRYSAKQPELDQDESPECDSPRMDATLPPCIETGDDVSMEPTLHDLQSRAAVEGWNKIRRQMLLTAVEASAMPEGQICVCCPEKALFRCQQCGPFVHYCYNCCLKQHEKANIFHVPEKWEENHYQKFQFQKKVINVRPLHSCDSSKEIALRCIDEYGVEHSISFQCCDCEPLSVTLVRARLWTANPHYPRYAFTFELLDWAECLLLECQVALKDFCQALYFRCRFPSLKRRDVYSCLIDAFEEYRFFKHEIRHLSFLVKGLDAGNQCPSCQKDSGKVIYALDALFGLPRKKAAGISFRPAILGKLFFCDQALVDEFVSEEGKKVKQVFQDCSNFVAGTLLRSSTRYKALDETGVFGSACRHEFPAKFMDMKHGERLAYPIWLIEEELLDHVNQGEKSTTDVFIMYDIACSLYQHMQQHGKKETLNRIHLSLPIFHSYGHKASCQIKFGPLRCNGIGLSDGETMERTWSYLRRFGKMTKEMRPAHRTDILSSALVHYGLKTKAKLGNLLVLRWKRAQDIHAIATETYHHIAEQYEEGGTSEERVSHFVTEELTIADAEKSRSRSYPPSWKSEYFVLLQSYLTLQDALSRADISQLQKLTMCHEIAQLNDKLKELERLHHMPHRWVPTDTEYMQVQRSFSSEKQSHISEALWATCARRQFLLKLKARYADGQKIAKKLSIQIGKETQKLKVLLQEYNSFCIAVGDDSNRLSFSDAVDSIRLAQVLNPKSCYSEKKQELIEAYLLQCRSGEELHMLKSDMHNAICYYENRVKVLETAIEGPLEVAQECNRGAYVLLLGLLQETNIQLTKLRKLFSNDNLFPQPNDSDSDFSSDDEQVDYNSED